MTTNVLICDDSIVARKQMARCLPEDWDINLIFAENGEECVSAIKEGKADLTFLDLNMPVMDGYEVLEKIKSEDLPSLVFVVSGDIQAEAQNRVKNLGAMDFVKKPIEPLGIVSLLQKFGFYTESDRAPTCELPDHISETNSKSIETNYSASVLETYQEVANIAMGEAASLLAENLDVFVLLPVPHVSELFASELQMALHLAGDKDTFSAVCQGFIGSGIAGEALLIVHDSSYDDMSKLIQYEGPIDENFELEVIMDMASILIGATLKSIADQLDIKFSQGHPVVLGQHVDVPSLIKNCSERSTKTLAIEINYCIENYNINCDLLLLITEGSLNTLKGKVEYLM